MKRSAKDIQSEKIIEWLNNNDIEGLKPEDKAIWDRWVFTFHELKREPKKANVIKKLRAVYGISEAQAWHDLKMANQYIAKQHGYSTEMLENLLIEHCLRQIQLAESGNSIHYWGRTKALEVLTKIYLARKADKVDENPDMYGKHQLFAFVQHNEININNMHRLPERERNILNELLMMKEIGENEVNHLFDAKEITQDYALSIAGAE